MVKLLMSWNIKPGAENDYFEFIVREFAPGLMKLGVQPTEVWYTVVGEGPQILTGGVAEDIDTMTAILANEEWDDLRGKLFEFVTDFQYKIVRATSKFQLL